MTHASQPGDYARLAKYFHYEEQIYRAKANIEMHEFAKNYSHYHPKNLNPCDTAERLYETYTSKANEQRQLATQYDRILIKKGIAPPDHGQIISLTDLKGESKPSVP